MHEGILRVSMSESKLASTSSVLRLQNKHSMVQRAKQLLCQSIEEILQSLHTARSTGSNQLFFFHRPVNRYTMETLKVCVTFLTHKWFQFLFHNYKTRTFVNVPICIQIFTSVSQIHLEMIKTFVENNCYTSISCHFYINTCRLTECPLQHAISVPGKQQKK